MAYCSEEIPDLGSQAAVGGCWPLFSLSEGVGWEKELELRRQGENGRCWVKARRGGCWRGLSAARELRQYVRERPSAGGQLKDGELGSSWPRAAADWERSEESAKWDMQKGKEVRCKGNLEESKEGEM